MEGEKQDRFILPKELSNIKYSLSKLDIIMASKDSYPFLKKTKIKNPASKVIFYPTTKNQIQKILKHMHVKVRGSGSSFSGQIIATKGFEEAIVDMSNFDDIKIDSENNIVTVGAGALFINLLRECAFEGLEIPVYPITYRSSTVGGFLASGHGIGFGSSEFGEFINTIEEIEAISGNGKIIKLKGDAINEIVASEGEYLIIINLKIRLAKKKRKLTHMYGVETRIDLLNYLENSDNTNTNFIFNKCAGNEFNKKWGEKHIPEYSIITYNYIESDDYSREYKPALHEKSISYIYPKWIKDKEALKINSLELELKNLKQYKGELISNNERKSKMFIADSYSDFDSAAIALRFAEENNIPVFGQASQDKIELRFYFDVSSKISELKTFATIEKIYSKVTPNSRGLFFSSHRSLDEIKESVSIKEKYDEEYRLPFNFLLEAKKKQYSKGVGSLLLKASYGLFKKTGGKLW